MATQQIHWNATGTSTGFAGTAANYSFVLSPAYNITEEITAVRIKTATGSVAPMTQTKIFIIDSSSQEILYISEVINFVTNGIYLEAEWHPNITLSVPFKIGFAPLDGQIMDYQEPDPADVVSPSTNFGSYFKHTDISIGAIWTGQYSDARTFGSQVEYGGSTPDPVEYNDIRRVNWDLSHGGGNTIAANSYQNSFIQSHGYNAFEGLITKVEVKITPTSTMSSAKIFLINALTNEVLYLSPTISMPTSRIIECFPNITLSVPFKVGIAPLSGSFYGSQQDPGEIEQQGTQSGLPTANTTLAVGATWTLVNTYPSYSFGSRVNFLVTRGSVNFIGGDVEYTKGNKTVITKTGVSSNILPSTKNVSNKDGKTINLLSSHKLSKIYSGQNLSLQSGQKLTRTLPGTNIYNLLMGSRNNTPWYGYHNENIVPADRVVQNYLGINTKISLSANAEYRYNLSVTPTHQHKNMLVEINLSRKSELAILGQYSLIINDIIIDDFSGVDQDINNIVWSLNPGQLANGVNKSLIKFKYPEAPKYEELSFEIFKEEPRRLSVERLFRPYDGGYIGDKLDSVLNIVPPFAHPSFVLPSNQVDISTIITSNYTSISLKHYTEVQQVTIDANGVRVLVSFDRGITWKSFISNAWQTVDISNISTQGMLVDTINTLTIANWSDIFTPTSIDFAVCMDRSLSAAVINDTFVPETQLWNDSITVYGQTTGYWNYGSKSFTCPTYYGISRIVWSGYGATNNDGQATNSYGKIFATLLDGTVITIANVMIFAGGTLSGAASYPISTTLRAKSVKIEGSSNNTALRGTASATVYGRPVLPYLKSINVQITPNLKTGYAFIM